MWTAIPTGRSASPRGGVHDRGLELARCGDGVRGVLVADHARDEEGDDAVADELVDHAGLAVDGPSRRLVEAIQAAAELGRA